MISNEEILQITSFLVPNIAYETISNKEFKFFDVTSYLISNLGGDMIIKVDDPYVKLLIFSGLYFVIRSFGDLVNGEEIKLKENAWEAILGFTGNAANQKIFD